MLRSFIVAAMLAVSVSAQGERPVNNLKTCLAESTSGKDRKDLAKWIFFALAAHPEIKQHLSANAATASDESSRAMAALFTRLLTESCVNEVKDAMKIGQGTRSLELAFQGLGELAMKELMSDTSVQDSMSVFERYTDQKRLAAVLGSK